MLPSNKVWVDDKDADTFFVVALPTELLAFARLDSNQRTTHSQCSADGIRVET
jgi:hypothetical protein